MFQYVYVFYMSAVTIIALPFFEVFHNQGSIVGMAVIVLAWIFALLVMITEEFSSFAEALESKNNPLVIDILLKAFRAREHKFRIKNGCFEDGVEFFQIEYKGYLKWKNLNYFTETSGWLELKKHTEFVFFNQSSPVHKDNASTDERCILDGMFADVENAIEYVETLETVSKKLRTEIKEANQNKKINNKRSKKTTILYTTK